MMKLFKTTLIVLVICVTQTGFSQTTITGKAVGYSNSKAKLESNPGLSKPEEIGTINSSGKFTLTIGAGHFDKVVKQVADYHKKHPGSLTFKTFKDRASCKNGSVTFTNGDQPMVKLIGRKGLFVHEGNNVNPSGFIMLLSSRDFKESKYFHYSGEAKKGYVIDYYYVKRPLKEKGTCSTERKKKVDNKPLKVKSKVDLDLKPGWNIIKTEVTEVYHAKNGDSYMTGFLMKSLDKIPAGAKFYFFEN